MARKSRSFVFRFGGRKVDLEPRALAKKLGFSASSSQNFGLFAFFSVLFGVVLLRLFSLQVLQASDFTQQLNAQHVNEANLLAERGHVFVRDNAGNEMQLTENINLYTIFVDPAFVPDKPRLIELLVPIFWTHFCAVNGFEVVASKQECVENIEDAVGQEVLPQPPRFFYLGSGVTDPDPRIFDETGFNNQFAAALSGFTTGQAEQLLASWLDRKIFVGVRPENYIGFFPDPRFLAALNEADFPFVVVENDGYLSIVPERVADPERDAEEFQKFLQNFGFRVNEARFQAAFYPQENRYVRLATEVNPQVIQDLKDLKRAFFSERVNRVPVLHGVGFETNPRRYYPFGSFMSHILGYVSKQGEAKFGVEEYLDPLLAGEDGFLLGRGAAFVGELGANDFDFQEPVDGSDVFLTIEPDVQREMERLTEVFHDQFDADSVSILVFDPFSGQVRASATFPNFDPNNFDSAYAIEPLGPENEFLRRDETFIDVPVYFRTGGKLSVATTAERFGTGTRLWINQNFYGPQVFVDKNIALAYEPGSIFKAFTMGVGFDSDEIRLYDFYKDPGEVRIGPFRIRNIAEECLGDKSFLNAFVWSCNVGMVRIAQRIGKEMFYDYLHALGFGQKTNVELAHEEQGFVGIPQNVSQARFFNNTYGQGMTATPMQIAQAYAALVNGGFLLQPTLVEALRHPDGRVEANQRKILRRIFSEETSRAMREALFGVLDLNEGVAKFVGENATGDKLGGKSGTSQIAFRGRYQEWNGWTNGSFVGLVTVDDPQYLVVVQVRRPRTVQRWSNTAGQVFGAAADFLLAE